jgi:hypothetical protein
MSQWHNIQVLIHSYINHAFLDAWWRFTWFVIELHSGYYGEDRHNNISEVIKKWKTPIMTGGVYPKNHTYSMLH